VIQVSDLEVVVDYLSSVAPPVPFLVKTPEIVPLDPTIALPPEEDTALAREHIESRLKQYLEVKAKPVLTITEGELEAIVIDGVEITSADVTLDGGLKYFSALQYPVLGDIAWA
jgi:hypothetical protein